MLRVSRSDIATALVGAIGAAALRLPPEIACQIAILADVTSWRVCADCGTPLLRLVTSVPFVARKKTLFVYDHRGWLLTNRGAIRSIRTAEAADLVLRGHGSITPLRQPRLVAVRTEHSSCVFENRITQMHQHAWYKIVDEKLLCRSCVWKVRRRRVWFRSWARRGTQQISE